MMNLFRRLFALKFDTPRSYVPIIKLVYVFSAQDENLPNFVVFRGSIGSKLFPMSKNWADNKSAKLKKQTISIKNYQSKGDLLRKEFYIDVYNSFI